MQIVIDIDENSYKATCSGSMLPPDVKNVVNAIKNGIVLSKGHGALIDRSKLVFYRCKENVMDCPPNYDFTC